MPNRPIRLTAAALLATAGLAGLAACGDDDDGGADAKLTAGCKADDALNDGITKFFNQTPALQGDGPPPKSATPQIRANYDRFVAGPVAQLQRDAPEEVAGDVKSAVADFRGVRNGDFSKVMAPAFENKTRRIDAYFFDNCEGTKSAVKGVDFAFQGLEDSYDAGRVRFKLDNAGKEVHEMAILRRKPSTKESFDQLLALPQRKAESKVDFVTSADGVEPGKASYANAVLAPGDYLAVCFIPQGSTPGKEGKGKPHFQLGMKQEFTVK